MSESYTPNTVTNVAAGKPKIGGAVFAAPVGTTLPTDATTALDAAFANLGYVSEDGLKNPQEMDKEIIKAWGGDEVLVTNNGRSDSFGYTLIEVLNLDVLKHIYGSANVSGTLADGITVNVNGSDTDEVSMVFELVLRGAVKRIVVPRARVTEVGEISYTDGDAVGYETTIACQADSAGNTHYEYIKTAAVSAGGGGTP
jgi:hypothetical protein